ncbi:MAG TPA: ABC transporter permease [Candidatus Desulfofervidus auxilii]|uniref:ABC transporter permease n=1 Tax=Desulfofervidus auxilii TaxID=1621989 RepID=A0A7V0IAK0_DESA2|nr:ABC transporter permease [Candidatus Desulfofervidus auxilii]
MSILIQFIEKLGNFTFFFFKTIRNVFSPPFRWKLFLEEMEFVGIQSFFVIMVTGTFVGMVVALGSYVGFRKLGAVDWLGPTVTVAVVAQLSPVLTGFMVTAKVGAAYAAELGTMRVTEQIDALEVMAIDPVHYLVVPKFLACIAMLPILTIFCDASGVFMGYIASTKILGVNAGSYIANTIEAVEFSDILRGILRAMTFGFLVPSIACFEGFYAGGGAKGVGNAVTKTVVISMVAILIDNYVFTTIFNYLVFWGG